MIEVVCDSCESSFRLKDESAGKLFLCKTCGESIRAPGGSAEKRSAPSSQFDDDEWEERDQRALPTRRTASRTAKRNSRKSRSSAPHFQRILVRLAQIDVVGIGGGPLALILIGLFVCGFQFRGAALAYMATVVCGYFAVTIICLIAVICVMGAENPICIVLSIFPPYALYYLVSRWDRVQIPVSAFIVALVTFCVGGYGGLSIYRANGVDVEEWNVFTKGGSPVAPVAAAQPAPGVVPNQFAPAPIVAATPAAGVVSADAAVQFPLDTVQIPEFRELEGPLSARSVPGVIYETTGVAPGAQVPGGQTNIRLHLPEGDHGLGSLPCILIAPAGATLLTGMALDPRDNATETGPWIEQGYAVVEYSLDGPTNSDHPTMMGPAYQGFKHAFAGLANARVALEFVMRKVPQVDPNRIYAVGHSSSGTLALLFAEHEPRIRGVVAFAPAADVESRMKDNFRQSNIDGERYFPGVTDFIRKSSPKTHVGMLNCPVLLLHAVDDTNVPVDDSRAFQGLLLSLGKQSTRKEFQSGGHFQFMINEGIPFALTWLNKLSNNTHPNAQLVVPQRNPEAPPPQLVPSQRAPGMTRQPVPRPRPITGRPPGL